MAARRWSIVLSVVVGATGTSLAVEPPTLTPPSMAGTGNTPWFPAPSATVTAGMTWPMAATLRTSEARYPFDAQDAWIHGYSREAPMYGGFNAFRPYNYKHVLIQSQIVTSWGLSPNMPYAQQLWRSETQTAMRGGAAANRWGAVASEHSASRVAASSRPPRIVPGVVVPVSAVFAPAKDAIEPWPPGIGNSRQH